MPEAERPGGFDWGQAENQQQPANEEDDNPAPQ